MIEDCLFKSGKGSRAALEGASGEQGGAAREHRGSKEEHTAQGSLNWLPCARLSA